MKVVWIVNEYNGPYNSMCTRQTVLGRYLEEYGYEVYLICGSSDYKGGKNYLSDEYICYKYVESDEAKFYVIKTTDYSNYIGRVLVAIQFQKRLWKCRNKLPKPDAIVSNFAGLFGNVFLRWKKHYGTKIIFDILDLWPEGFVDMGYLNKNALITKILYKMEHKTYRDADGLIFSMQGGKKYITEKGWGIEVGGDIDTNTIGYLNNGVDLERVDRQKEEYVLNDPDLDTDKFKVVYIGSISEFNGLDVLLRTARILLDNGEKKFSLYFMDMEIGKMN